MRTAIYLSLALLLSAAVAEAAIPPSYFIAEKIAKRKASLETAIVQVELIQPGSAAEKIPGSRLWQGNIFYDASRKNLSKDPSQWPLLAILLEPDPAKLMLSLKSFGVPMSREEDLVNKRARADARANPEADIVFYKHEDSLSVRRWNDRLAWQIAGANSKFLVEKDSFNPLMLSGPCPEGFGSSFFGGGNEPCTIEFRHEANSTMQIPTAVTLKVGDRDVLVMRVNRVILNPGEKLVKDLVKPNQESVDKAEAPTAAFYSRFLR